MAIFLRSDRDTKIITVDLGEIALEMASRPDKTAISIDLAVEQFRRAVKWTLGLPGPAYVEEPIDG